jgi:hypothetical protein
VDAPLDGIDVPRWPRLVTEQEAPVGEGCFKYIGQMQPVLLSSANVAVGWRQPVRWRPARSYYTGRENPCLRHEVPLTPSPYVKHFVKP